MLTVGLSMGLCLLIVACGTSSPGSTPTHSSPSPTHLEVTPSPTATSNPTPTPTATSAILIGAQELEGVEITLWHPWSGKTGEAIQTAVEEFNKQNPYGVHAESQYQGTYNDLYALIDSAQSSKELPSLAIGYDYTILGWLKNGKGVADLNSYVEDPTWGLTQAEKADFYPVVLEQGVQEGERFGFPAERLTRLMVYNLSWAEELGFNSPPQSVQEFQNQACVAAKVNKQNTDPTDDRTGGWLIDTSHSTVFSWLSAFGAEITTPDGKDYQFNTPAAAEALTFLKDLYDSGCAWEPQNTDPKEAFAERRALFITLPLIELPQLQESMLTAENQDIWSVLAIPGKNRDPLIDLYGPFYAVFAESQEERLAAWLLIKWLVAPEQQARFIEARGSYPTRNSALQLLRKYAKENPQWLQATEFIPEAVSEPSLVSWDDVRWMLEDVGSQLFRYYYTADRIPLTLDLMDETAEELQQQDP